jgi:ankyrin repeat protein
MSKKDHHKESIHRAVQRGNYEAVASLLKKKPHLVNAEDESGHTPIHLAALHGYYDIAELLVQNGADLNKQDASGWTALHFAASGRNEKLLKFFLDQPSADGKSSTFIVKTESRDHSRFIQCYTTKKFSFHFF